MARKPRQLSIAYPARKRYATAREALFEAIDPKDRAQWARQIAVTVAELPRPTFEVKEK